MQINYLTATQAESAGLENWIGTLGRGKYDIDAKPVKTAKQAAAWVRRVSKGQGFTESHWYVFPVQDYKGNPLGFGACAGEMIPEEPISLDYLAQIQPEEVYYEQD